MESVLNSYVESDAYFQCVLLFIFSMFPITECRITIPIGIIAFKLPWYMVFILCVIANAAVGILLIFTLDWLISIFSRINIFKKLLNKFIDRSGNKFEKYQRFKSNGLILFVGIPLPGTGAWTGALVSYIIGLNKGLSILSIILGVILSGIIVTILSLTGQKIIFG